MSVPESGSRRRRGAEVRALLGNRRTLLTLVAA